MITMMNRVARVVEHAVVAAGLCGSATLATPKLKILPAATEANWIQTAKQHWTKDGATVAEVLAYAEKTRPRVFKAGPIEVGYNGASGVADAVTIGYWIGTKRTPDDAFIDLNYAMSPDGRVMPVSPDAQTTTALENGRLAFLRAVDDAYQDTCLHTVKHPKRGELSAVSRVPYSQVAAISVSGQPYAASASHIRTRRVRGIVVNPKKRQKCI